MSLCSKKENQTFCITSVVLVIIAFLSLCLLLIRLMLIRFISFRQSQLYRWFCQFFLRQGTTAFCYSKLPEPLSEFHSIKISTRMKQDQYDEQPKFNGPLLFFHCPLGLKSLTQSDQLHLTVLNKSLAKASNNEHVCFESINQMFNRISPDEDNLMETWYYSSRDNQSNTSSISADTASEWELDDEHCDLPFDHTSPAPQIGCKNRYAHAEWTGKQFWGSNPQRQHKVNVDVNAAGDQVVRNMNNSNETFNLLTKPIRVGHSLGISAQTTSTEKSETLVRSQRHTLSLYRPTSASVSQTDSPFSHRCIKRMSESSDITMLSPESSHSLPSNYNRRRSDHTHAGGMPVDRFRSVIAIL